jgi:ribonuclease J
VAYALDTPAGLVVYTGDLRRHGRWGEKTEGFLRALEGREVFLLILEGTRLGQRGKALTEGEVAENLHCLLAEHPGAPAAVDFAPRNLERLLSCLEVGKEVGRKLVVTPKDAYLLLDLRLLERALGRDPGEGVYVFSNSYWADQEQVLDLRVLLGWLERLRFRLYPEALRELPQDPSGVENPFHTSGHAPEGDLLEVVRRLRPRHLLPVHTERPERWRELLRGKGVEVLPREEG